MSKQERELRKIAKKMEEAKRKEEAKAKKAQKAANGLLPKKTGRTLFGKGLFS